MRWVHAGAGNVDWVADLAHTHGTLVAVDDSDDWVTDVAAWGAPNPVATVAGLYRISVYRHATSDPCGFNVTVWDPAGMAVWADGDDHPIMRSRFSEDASGHVETFEATLYLPAGSHLSVDVEPAASTSQVHVRFECLMALDAPAA